MAKTQTPKFNLRSYTMHPLANQYPMMNVVELRLLKEDIQLHGQKQPVITYKKQIIDGRNRWMACRDLDIECRTEEYTGPEEDIPALIKSLNEHRRHLTPEFVHQRRQERINRVAEARKAGDSLRKIAAREGISKTQIEMDLKQAAGVQGWTPETEGERVTGQDGKSYAAKQPRATPDVKTAKEKAKETRERRQEEDRQRERQQEEEATVERRLWDMIRQNERYSTGFRELIEEIGEGGWSQWKQTNRALIGRLITSWDGVAEFLRE